MYLIVSLERDSNPNLEIEERIGDLMGIFGNPKSIYKGGGLIVFPKGGGIIWCNSFDGK